MQSGVWGVREKEREQRHQRGEGARACGGLVEEEEAGAGDDLHPHGAPLLLVHGRGPGGKEEGRGGYLPLPWESDGASGYLPGGSKWRPLEMGGSGYPSG